METPAQSNSQVTWIKGGTALSVGWLAWSLYRGRWGSARFGFRLALAFLAKWGELRLRARVRSLVFKAGTSV